MSWSFAMDRGDEMVEKAFAADNMANRYHYFKVAQAMYEKAEAPFSARWCAAKASQCWCAAAMTR